MNQPSSKNTALENKIDAPEVCLHCGLRLQNTQSSFCCAGCEFVFSAIHELGLQDFYNYRTGPITPIDYLPGKTSFEALDHPDFIKSHLQEVLPNELYGRFHLQGIHCAGCLWIIEGLPTLLPGVSSCVVNLSSASIQIRFQPGLIRLSEIAAFLDKLGYRLQTHASLAKDTSSEDTRTISRLGIAGFSAMNSMMIAVSLYQGEISGIESQYANYFRWVSFLVTLPAVTYCAFPFYRSALAAIKVRRFHIDLPLSIAIIGAFVLSVWNTVISRSNVYFDSVTALIFLLLAGRQVQQRALIRARRETQTGWGFLPTSARQKVGTEYRTIPIELLSPETIIEIRSGERIAADGVVIEGDSSIDTSILTGESYPQSISTNEKVHAGTLNIAAPILVQVTAAGENTRVGRLLSHLDQMQGKRGHLSDITEKASVYFVSIVLCLSLITISLWWAVDPLIAIDNTIALLIVTCPCALGFGVPLALGISTARAMRLGILIKGADTIERLAKVNHIFFDKTGTLTKGKFKVVYFEKLLVGISESEIQSLAIPLAKAASSHPVANAIQLWASNNSGVVDTEIRSIITRLGAGVQGTDVSGEILRLGSVGWVSANIDIITPHAKKCIEVLTEQNFTPTLLARGEEIIAVFGLADETRTYAKNLITQLKRIGISSSILSGDKREIVINLGRDLGLTRGECVGEVSPEEKEQVVSNSREFCAMMGDGVNDCAAMKGADVAVGLRGGFELNFEVADVFLIDPEPEGMFRIFKGAKRTLSCIRRTLVISVCYNVAAGAGAMFGFINPLIAAVLMPISSLTVIGLTVFSKTFDHPGDEIH